MLPKIIAVILNWNRADDTIVCVRSVLASDYPALECLVVDNGSRPEDVSKIRQALPQIKIIENGANLGYAEGNNVGLRYAVEQGAEYGLILNNDTEVAPDAISEMARVARTLGDKAGVIGSAVYKFEDRSRLHNLGMTLDIRGGGRFIETMLDADAAGYQDGYREVDSAHGCAMLIPAAVLRDIGYIDRDFFLMHEEADFCVRARLRQYKVVTAYRARVWHAGAATFGERSPHKLYYRERNRYLYTEKRLRERGRLADSDAEFALLSNGLRDQAENFLKEGDSEFARVLLAARHAGQNRHFGKWEPAFGQSAVSAQLTVLRLKVFLWALKRPRRRFPQIFARKGVSS